MVGCPLTEWPDGAGAMLIVGTLEIIGEFAGNRHLVGKKGLNLKMQSLDGMYGRAGQIIKSGADLLDTISTQILDLKSIEAAQQPKERRGGR